MKAVILAGGLGTRISEETSDKPKPMVMIGKYPILWHIMKLYEQAEITDFIICCGYKKEVIKKFFLSHSISENTDEKYESTQLIVKFESNIWKVNLVDTGYETMTGGRLKRVSNYVKEEDFFCFTYGDGVSDIDIKDKINFHRKHKKLATITAVHPPSRFGALKIDNNNVVNSFKEKDEDSNDWINGGFFVLSPKVIELISDDMTIWEKQPVENLSKMGELIAYKHTGFWQPMDTLREKRKLENLWKKNSAPWKNWK